MFIQNEYTNFRTPVVIGELNDLEMFVSDEINYGLKNVVSDY